MLYLIAYAVFLAFACVFVLSTINKLPRDIGAIRAAFREDNRTEKLASIAVALFMWVVSLVLIAVVIGPGVYFICSQLSGIGQLIGIY